MQTGAGYFVYTPTPARTPYGVGAFWDIALGASLTRHWVLSASLLGVVGPTLDREPQFLTTVAAFVAQATYYFDSNLFLELGFGVGGTSAQNSTPHDNIGGAGAGPVLKAAFGKEWWVSNKWAVGGALRLTGSRAEEDDAGPYAPVWNTGTAGILFSATCN